MAGGKYNVGIIGYGLSAKIFHIPFVSAVPEFNLYAIVQRSPKPNDDASKDHPHIKLYHSAEEMVKDDQVHVVIVTTAPESHLQLAKLALEAKKHVVVEKPFTPTSSEANELVALAQRQGVLLTVYQNRRFDADFLTLKKCIQDGALGRVVEFETHFDRHRPDSPSTSTWKSHPAPGTGAAYDLGTHLMDQVVHLFGLPKRVTGFVGSQRAVNETGLEDSCTILLHYDSMLATVKAGVVSPEINQLRYWVRGEKGSFKKFHLDPQEDQLKAGLRPGDKGYGIEPDDRHAVLTSSSNGKITSAVEPPIESEGYVEYYRRLAAALDGDVSQIPVDPVQGAAVIRLVELARESSQAGRTLDVDVV